MVAHSGDGYVNTPMDTGSENPHSPAELLRGVTIGKLALFVLYGLADVAALELLLNVGEKARVRTQVKNISVKFKSSLILQLVSLL